MTPSSQRSLQRIALTAALLALTGLATACGGGDANVEPSAADPQSYYESYDPVSNDSAGATSSKAGGQATSADDAGEPGSWRTTRSWTPG